MFKTLKKLSTFLPTHTYMYINVFYICVYINTCIMCVYTHICIYTHAWIMCVCIYAHTHACLLKSSYLISNSSDASKKNKADIPTVSA